MSIMATHDGNHTLININGKFSFKDYVDFRKAYQDRPKGAATQYTIDLDGVEYIDSAALGMLILLREHAGEGDAVITIHGASGMVLEALEMSNYDQLFRVE